MKFKAKSLQGASIELHSTRNVTLFESPEFGHMVVDGKMADSKAVDSGRLRMVVEVATLPGYLNAPMGYNPLDFKLVPGYFVCGAEVSVHGLVIGKYSSRYKHDTNVIQYAIDVPEKYRHDSKLLEQQLYRLVAGLTP